MVGTLCTGYAEEGCGLVRADDTTWMPHTAMIFAAGLGTRMRPLTEHTPKPLIQVAGKALLDYRLDALAAAGVQRAVINTHYLADQIEAHVAGRTDIEVILSHEVDILETGGGLVHAKEYLGNDPIFVLNSDVIWLDTEGGANALWRLAEKWNPMMMDLMLLLHPCVRAVGYHGAGDFELENDGIITHRQAKTHPYVYTGIQILNLDILNYIQETKFSLSQIFKLCLDPSSILYQRAYGIEHQGEWLHVDSPEALTEAEQFLSKR